MKGGNNAKGAQLAPDENLRSLLPHCSGYSLLFKDSNELVSKTINHEQTDFSNVKHLIVYELYSNNIKEAGPHPT